MSTLEGDLSARLRAGDEAAWSEYVDAQTPKLDTIGRRMGQSPQASEDARQEALFAQWQHRGSIKPDQNHQAYLHRAMRHKVVDQQREAKSQARKIQALSQQAERTHHTTIEEQVLTRERIRAATKKNPIVASGLAGGYKQTEIARQLHLKAQSKSAISRARKSLRDA